MEYTQEQVDVLNAQKDLDEAETVDLNFTAAKQLLMELTMLKRKIYENGMLVTSVLIVQIKQVLRGLIRKYNDAGLLIGENITLKLANKSKHANISFVYSPGLFLLMQRVEADMIEVRNKMISESNKQTTDN